MSDKNCTVQQLRNRTKRFIEERDWEQFHTLKDLGMGLSIEAAEFMENLRFVPEVELYFRLNDDGELIKDLSDELADVLYFVLAISNFLEIDLSQAFESKMLDNKIKYSIAEHRGINKKYNEH